MNLLKCGMQVFPAGAGVILISLSTTFDFSSVPCGCRGDPKMEFPIMPTVECSLRVQG